MKIYYAHHLYKYNTKVEKYELDLIKREFDEYEIINPNGDIIHEDMTNETKIMEECLNKVTDCYSLVFSSMNNVVGKGVFDEVDHALKIGKAVYYITGNSIIKFDKGLWIIIDESRSVYAILV